MHNVLQQVLKSLAKNSTQEQDIATIEHGSHYPRQHNVISSGMHSRSTLEDSLEIGAIRTGPRIPDEKAWMVPGKV